MIEDIRAAFNELLDENEWMDEETKDVAREKVSCKVCDVLWEQKHSSDVCEYTEDWSTGK